MGGELASDSPPEGGGESAPISISQFFWESLPFFLSIGMSADEFWNGDPKLAKSYLKAYEITEKRNNIDFWKQGLYFYNALGAVAPALHAFAKDPKIQPYLKDPIPFTKVEEKEYKEREEKRKMRELKDQLTAFAIDYNKRREAKNNAG